MGTRADFYVGRGENAEWLGSIAFDGYPSGLPDILRRRAEKSFRAQVERIMKTDDSATRPSDGWPWPWDDSGTTDFAYAFEGGKVWASCFGREWVEAKKFDDLSDDQQEALKENAAVFPDMSSRRAMPSPASQRSGLLVVGVK